jgi:hypothetical protein
MYECLDKICSSIWSPRLSVILCSHLHLLMQFLMPGMIYKKSCRLYSSRPLPHCCIPCIMPMELLWANCYLVKYPTFLPALEVRTYFGCSSKFYPCVLTTFFMGTEYWLGLVSCLSSGGYKNKQLLYNCFFLFKLEHVLAKRNPYCYWLDNIVKLQPIHWTLELLVTSRKPGRIKESLFNQVKLILSLICPLCGLLFFFCFSPTQFVQLSLVFLFSCGSHRHSPLFFFFVMLQPRLFALDLIVRASSLAPLRSSFSNR